MFREETKKTKNVSVAKNVSYICSMNDKTNQVVAAALELFMKLGIKSLTMDDVASKLGMSKKTLYQYVSDKKDLVRKGMQIMIEEDVAEMQEVIDGSPTAIDELIGITKKCSSKLGEMHPAVIFDLQKYHPSAWKLMEEHKVSFIYNVMLDNLKRGIKEGYYRENINPLVIASVYMGMVDNMLNPEHPISKMVSLERLHVEIIRYHIKGVSNDKGNALLKETLSKEENNHLDID